MLNIQYPVVLNLTSRNFLKKIKYVSKQRLTHECPCHGILFNNKEATDTYNSIDVS